MKCQEFPVGFTLFYIKLKCQVLWKCLCTLMLVINKPLIIKSIEVKNSFLNSTKKPRSTMEESYCKILHEMLPVADNPSCVLSVHFILRN